jgi:hypothetical protein
MLWLKHPYHLKNYLQKNWLVSNLLISNQLNLIILLELEIPWPISVREKLNFILNILQIIILQADDLSELILFLHLHPCSKALAFIPKSLYFREMERLIPISFIIIITLTKKTMSLYPISFMIKYSLKALLGLKNVCFKLGLIKLKKNLIL